MSEKNTSKLVTIEGRVRTGTGKSVTRKIRKAGWIPGNIVDRAKPLLIELNPHALPKAFKAEGKKFTLSIDGAEKTVAITEMQYCPVKRFALHVDLKYV